MEILICIALKKTFIHCTCPGTNVKGYMDPMVGAPIEYLNRINELSKLQAITKRWERTRCRRRVKKDMVINKSVVDPIR
uniref:Uncharacterized protein n=1 Tax=Schistosoma mansoni TaxID=6183 RepID=A0A5K4EME0_SCHMA